MIISDIIEQATKIFGQCSTEKLFEHIQMAVILLQNKCPMWDANQGEISLCASENMVTLPRFVGTPVGVAVNGVPAIARDKLYIYHANGAGPCLSFATGNYWTDYGNRPVLREIPRTNPSRLIAIMQLATDANKSFRVFGQDPAGKELYTLKSDGTTEPGILLPMNFNPAIANPTLVGWIDYIVRERTNGFVQLWAVGSNPDRIDLQANDSYLLGDYAPDETQPTYRRIQLPCKAAVRMRYRRANLPFNNLNDYVPLNNKLALIKAMQAVREHLNNNSVEALKFEMDAKRLADDEQEMRNAPTHPGIQINVLDGTHNEQLYNFGTDLGYGGYGGWGGGGYN